MPQDSIHQRLRALIGRRFCYGGEDWLVIDVLADDDALVLQRVGTSSGPIQADLYGQAARRVCDTLVLPVSGDSPDQLSQDIVDLLNSPSVR
ncbi:MAG: hypothetical protein MUF57_02610 [Gammaproteobacteria bacterium]|jgi:hypothetical protein|nr:hypothetical protein [Gammaproteobacteria bacterium]